MEVSFAGKIIELYIGEFSVHVLSRIDLEDEDKLVTELVSGFMMFCNIEYD